MMNLLRKTLVIIIIINCLYHQNTVSMLLYEMYTNTRETAGFVSVLYSHVKVDQNVRMQHGF